VHLTDNLEAWDDFLRGVEYQWNFTKEGNVKAKQMFEQATQLDSRFAAAYVLLGWSYWFDWAWQWSDDPNALEHAFALTRHAVDLDDSAPEAHALLARLYLMKRQYDQAIAEGERTIALNPNLAQGYFQLAEVLNFSGQPRQAIELAAKAMRLDPRAQDFYLIEFGFADLLTGQYEQSIRVLKRHLVRYTNNEAAHVSLAIAYAELGRQPDAEAESAELMRINPQFSLETFKQRAPIKDQTLVKRYVADLRKAGLK
jgi:adenylate cyclase